MSENPIPFEIPGKSRILTKEEIAAEYGERATRTIPDAYYQKKGVGPRIYASQIQRWRVYRVYANGNATFMSAHSTFYAADIEAGRLRDEMTDEECAKDYTYEARERLTSQRKFKGGGKPWGVYALYPDGRRVFVSSHHTDTAAENKANGLNNGLKAEFVYTIGERKLR